jgi:hydroxymethylbilane synthase
VTLRLGTRGSALALTQTQMVADALAARLGGADAGGGEGVELVRVRTDGDRLPGSLASLGGTGVFVTALREALLDGGCDLAVHSMKDLPTAPPAGLRLAAVPERADPRDALCARDGLTLATLPAGARVGTGSPRRAAQLLAARPDLDVVDIRGNVPTRLGRVAGHERPGTADPGDLDAVVLAMAGLTRLGRLDAMTEALDPAVMLPAPAQGALAIEAAGPLDPAAEAALAALDHPATRLAVLAERSLLAALEAGCAAPVGALGRFSGTTLRLEAVACAPDGSRRLTASGDVTLADDALTHDAARPDAARGAEAAAVGLGERVARELLARGAADLVRESRSAARLRAPALTGWTVLVPRGGEWAERAAALLTPHGALTLAVPLIEFAPPQDLAPLDAALEALAAGAYDWLTVTSATTVAALDRRARERAGAGADGGPGSGTGSGPLADLLGTVRVAAVGPATAEALETLGVHVTLVPAEHSALGLLAALPPGPGRALVPHSDLADATLVDGLATRGWRVDAPVAYRTVPGPPPEEHVRAALAAGDVHAVLLTSPSTVTQLLAQVGTPPPGTVVACVGHRTRRAAEEAGLTVHVTPREASLPALVDALVSHVLATHDQENR